MLPLALHPSATGRPHRRRAGVRWRRRWRLRPARDPRRRPRRRRASPTCREGSAFSIWSGCAAFSQLCLLVTVTVSSPSRPLGSMMRELPRLEQQVVRCQQAPSPHQRSAGCPIRTHYCGGVRGGFCSVGRCVSLHAMRVASGHSQRFVPYEADHLQWATAWTFMR